MQANEKVYIVIDQNGTVVAAYDRYEGAVNHVDDMLAVLDCSAVGVVLNTELYHIGNGQAIRIVAQELTRHAD